MSLIKNSLWNASGSLISKGVAFLSQLIIARLLGPEIYGTYAIAMSIMLLAMIVKDLGLQHAIIVNREEKDYYSLQFTVQLITAVVLFLITILISGHIESFFDIDDFGHIVSLMMGALFLFAFQDPVITEYLKENNYKLLFYRQLIPSISFACIAIPLAMNDFGVYSLVYAYLGSQLISTLFFTFMYSLMPKLYLNARLIARLFKVAKHVIVQSFSGFLVQGASSLVVGKNIGAHGAGVFSMSSQLTLTIPSSIFPQIQQVAFTSLARDPESISKYYKRYYNAIMMTTLMGSIAAYFLMPVLVPLVLGDKWLEAIDIIQLFSLSIATAYAVGINNEISKIVGFSHIYSYYAVVRSVATIVGLYVGSLSSLEDAVIYWVLISIIFNLINDLLFSRYQSVIGFYKEKILLYTMVAVWIVVALSLYKVV